MPEDRRKTWWQALSLAGQLGWVIAVPLVLFAAVGQLLDKQLDTSPWLLLGGIGVSILVSTIGLVFQFQRIIQQYNKDNKNNTKKIV